MNLILILSANAMSWTNNAALSIRYPDSGEALDRKLQALLGSASLIISLVGTIQLVALRQTGGLVFWVFVAPELILFIVMVILIMRGLQPLIYLNPIANTWKELAILFFDEPEDRVLGTLIYNYLHAIEVNQARNATKTFAVERATRTFMVIVIVGVVSIPVSLSAQFVVQQGTPQPSTSTPIASTPTLQPQPTFTLTSIASTPTLTPLSNPLSQPTP